jgi:uncharacterized membrane protein YgcG
MAPGRRRVVKGADGIIQSTILPSFRAARMADGIMAGSEAIIREITT